MDNQELETNKRMTADEAATILSQTMRDVSDRKITLRRALTISRVALALAKVIGVADLDERLKFIEMSLKKRKI